MRILIAGAGGRLGAQLERGLRAGGHDVLALPRTQLDIRFPAQVDETIRASRPDVIANCSAYNAVDAAEHDPGPAYAVNAEGPALLAAAARAAGAVLVHYSTDFVFDGEATAPYTEDCPTRPLNVYGASKLAGEEAVRTVPRHYILRLESLFGGRGQQTTIDRIADRLLSGSTVRAFVDRTVSPSYVPDVVAVTAALLEGGAAYGTYHCVNSGLVTWFDLAVDIAERLGVACEVEPSYAGNMRTAAPRPKFCALSNQKLRHAGIRVPSWESALARHLVARHLPADVGRAAVTPGFIRASGGAPRTI